MRRLTFALVSFLTAAAVVTLSEDTAHACGGCFVPPTEVTAVDSHRMVIALGMDQTILWDQIIYSGNPSDFVWVLPVPTPEVDIEVTDNDFFDRIDRDTAPRIQPFRSPRRCRSSEGLSCAANDPALYSDGPGADGVIVYDHGVVGPYATLTIGAEDPNALYAWLTDNGYNIAEESIPVMDHYIALEHAFIVLRLRPDADVSAMQPVRVRYPGFMGTFPAHRSSRAGVGLGYQHHQLQPGFRRPGRRPAASRCPTSPACAPACWSTTWMRT